MSNRQLSGATVDEYLWPLTGSFPSLDWARLTEELRIRQRLAAIEAHLDSQHIGPRLHRLGPWATTSQRAIVRSEVIDGPESAPPWQQRLRGPVPRALQSEWQELAERLRTLREGKSRARK